MWTVIIVILLLIILYKKFVYPNGQPWIKKGRFSRDVWVPENIPLEYTRMPVDISQWSLTPSNRDTSDIASYPTKTEKGTLREIIEFSNRKNPNTALQWKALLLGQTPLEQWLLNRMAPIINTIEQSYSPVPPDEIKIRMSTNPWSFHSHFDCINNYAVQIYGRKDILLWSKGGRTSHQQEEVLKTIRSLNNIQAKQYLKTLGINCIHWRTSPGDLFYIPQGWYHKIESINTTPLSILLNYNTLSNYQSICENSFKQLWAKQTKKCTDKYCLD